MKNLVKSAFLFLVIAISVTSCSSCGHSEKTNTEKIDTQKTQVDTPKNIIDTTKMADTTRK